MIYLKDSSLNLRSRAGVSNRWIYRFLFALGCLLPNKIVALEQDESSRLVIHSTQPFSGVSVDLDKSAGQSVIRVDTVLDSLDDRSLAVIASDDRISWDDKSLTIVIDDPRRQFAVVQSADQETALHSLRVFLQPLDADLNLNGLSSTGRPSQSALTGSAAYHWLENEKRSSENSSLSLDAKRNVLLNTIEAALIGEYE